MNNLTQNINEHNLNSIRKQIELKKGYKPFLATSVDSTGVVTDYDVFPYPRYFRGVPTSDKPIVAEREAGWRQRNPGCYRPNVSTVTVSNPIPHLDFQAPDNMVIPPGATCNARYR